MCFHVTQSSPGEQRPLSTAAALFVALIAGALALLALASTPADAGSAKLGKKHCLISGGGRFVDIPEFEGETIDRRLLKDIAWMRRKFQIHVDDGFSTDKSHQRNGEHPIGLALDIVPDESIGGTWGDVNDLARWAEPRQNRPREPFRWIGYWGDKRHGPRDHLHISWDHSPTRPERVARSVETVFCP